MNGRARSGVGLVLIGLIAALLFVTLVGLGVWQVERRAWKHALVAQVADRLQQSPTQAPHFISRLSALPLTYTRLFANGRWIAGRDTLVQASTRFGPGYWLLTPLRTNAGPILLVNRGYVPDRRPVAIPAGPVRVTGLLRQNEPRGGFLRANDPAIDRWYSRDIIAIAAARRLGPVEPYFIDADAAASSSPGGPAGGLTVISFPDNHLVYALTWFGLALLVAGGYVLVLRDAWRRRVGRATPP